MNRKILKKLIKEILKKVNENVFFRGKKGTAVMVKFFNSSTGKNDEQPGIITEPKNTNVRVRLRNHKEILVPWEYVTPDISDPDPNKDFRTRPQSTGW